jgi:hypothetical protein
MRPSNFYQSEWRRESHCDTRAVEPTSVGRAAGGGNAPLLVAPPFQPEIFYLNQNIALELCASGLLVPGC